MRCAVWAKLMTLFCWDTAELYIPCVPVASSTCTNHDKSEESAGNLVLVTPEWHALLLVLPAMVWSSY